MSKLKPMPPMYSIIGSRAGWALGDQFCAFALMAKAPRVGSVKTRLVPPLTPDEAAQLSRCFIRDMSASISDIAVALNAIGVVAFSPAHDATAFDNLLPPEFHLLPQRGADLGERLLHAAEDLFAAGFAAVCLINADSPTLPSARLTDAAALLRQPGDRVVLGEADDGGYYLIGLKRPYARLFSRIDWSTSRVFSQSIERAAEIGLEVASLARWYDVDDGPTLRRLYEECLQPEGRKASKIPAPETSRFLAELANRNPVVRALFSDRHVKVPHD
jgi:rSAM/selenodomain-associated transferase 1